MKIIFSALSEEERTAQFATLDADALAAALTEARNEAAAIFALAPEARTVQHADDAEALVASMGLIEAEQVARQSIADDAAARFAAAAAAFSNEAEADAEEADEADAEAEATVTAAAVNHRTSQAMGTVASKVAKKAKRPSTTASTNVVITAAADVPGIQMGGQFDGLNSVAAAMQARARNFPSFSARAAESKRQATGGVESLNKVPIASINLDFAADMLVKSTDAAETQHDKTKMAVKAHVERITNSLSTNPVVQTAAMAWCSPSEVVYNWLADYVVDGLLSLPGIPAPRGGLLLTEGPQLAQTTYGTPGAVDGFGFGGTEAEMEAGYIKTCETIECPEFIDHRLDFDGYCWKIPLLTESTFPELIADAMRLSDVLYAHKMNRRRINDIISMSTEVDATNAFGGVQVDTLEAFTQVAIKERRWWNLGENAVMEVKLAQEALTIFQFDMARRSGLALNDVATVQKVQAHFAAHNLAVEYLSDFDQRFGAATPAADWPEVIRGIIYPAGTFVEAQKDVINISAVYDAASLSENEYTGVFYEQGIKIIKRGYRSHVVTVPVCVAGRTGANDLTCSGFVIPGFDGSF